MAIIEREMRRFRRSPMLIVMSMIHARLVRNPIADRLVPDRAVTADGVAAIARHITRFSLAGIRATAAA
jgi:hypothetical protein